MSLFVEKTEHFCEESLLRPTNLMYTFPENSQTAINVIVRASKRQLLGSDTSNSTLEMHAQQGDLCPVLDRSPCWLSQSSSMAPSPRLCNPREEATHLKSHSPARSHHLLLEIERPRSTSIS